MTKTQPVVAAGHERRPSTRRKPLVPYLIIVGHLLLTGLLLLPFVEIASDNGLRVLFNGLGGHGRMTHRVSYDVIPGVEIGFAGWLAVPAMLLVCLMTVAWEKKRTATARRTTGLTNLACLVAIPICQFDLNSLDSTSWLWPRYVFLAGWFACVIFAVWALLDFTPVQPPPRGSASPNVGDPVVTDRVREAIMSEDDRSTGVR